VARRRRDSCTSLPVPTSRGRGRPDAWPLQERWLDGYWISRTEVTVGEYLEFLNDADTLAAIAEESALARCVRVPEK
jgi:formylglycine-generating enzyme required for sulfatase activity